MTAGGGDTEGSAATRARAVLERIAEEVGVQTRVKVAEDAESVMAEFTGEDLGLLIGHHGQTIDAIQHLVQRVVFQGREERKRLVVDAAGYRERRGASLRASADEAAEAALRGGRAVGLDAMSAQERKVVHEHLSTRVGVETYSEGQEPSRHVVVAPVVE
ncbi:MAG: protein jag [Solirubrobacteraceae bacterium]